MCMIVIVISMDEHRELSPIMRAMINQERLFEGEKNEAHIGEQITSGAYQKADANAVKMEYEMKMEQLGQQLEQSLEERNLSSNELSHCVIAFLAAVNRNTTSLRSTVKKIEVTNQIIPSNPPISC